MSLSTIRDEFSQPWGNRGLECLRRLQCLKDCKESFLEKIGAGLTPRFVGPNETIINEGEEAKELLLLWRGGAQALSPEGQVLENFLDGATIGGETLLLTRFVYPYTVKSTDCCELQALPLKEFRMAVSRHQEEGHKIAKALNSGAKETSRQQRHAPSTQKQSSTSFGRQTSLPAPATPRDERRKSNDTCVNSGSGSPGPGAQSQRGTYTQAARSSRERRSSFTDINQKPDSRRVGLTDTTGAASIANHLASGAVDREPRRPPGDPRSGLARTARRHATYTIQEEQPVARKTATADKLSRLKRNINNTIRTETFGKEEDARQEQQLVTATSQQRKGKARRRGRFGPNGSLVCEDSPEFGQTSFQMWAYAEQENDEASLRELAGWLDSIPFFSAMDAFCFERILPLVQKTSFKKGEMVLAEGSLAEALHVVYAGKADVVMDGKVVGSVGPKSVVGERSICRACATDMDEAPVCCASIVVNSAFLVTVSLPREKLIEVCRKDECVSRQFEELFDRERQARGEIGLSNTLLFKDADPTFAEHLDVTLKLVPFMKGATLMTKGETADEAYILSKGTVKITCGTRPSSEARVVTVSEMREAIVFGIQNLLGILPTRTATVVAMSACVAHVIQADPLRRLLEEFPAESLVFRRMVEKGFDEHLAMQEDVRSEAKRMKGASEDGGSAEPDIRILDMTREGQSRHHAEDQEAGTEEGQAQGDGLEKLKEEDEPSTSEDSSGSESESSSRQSDSDRSSALQAALEIDGAQKISVPWGLSQVKELRGSSEPFLRKLEAQLRPRVYLPGQVVLRQGEDMEELYFLQAGCCEVSVFGANLDPISGAELIGGSLSWVAPKALTTVAAKETCFVATVAKRQAAAVLDLFPADRRALLSTSNQAFEQLCDSFHQHYVGLSGLERSLAALPFLSGSSEDFLSLLASLLCPQLLLPGQVVLDGSSDLAADEEVKLYILFGGYCHQISDGVVVGTISQKMVFGELEVFGIEESRGWHMQVKTVELCEVATVTRRELFRALKRFPEERPRFEQLVHNRLETSVHSQVISLSFFTGLPNDFLSRVCVLLDRRLCFQDVKVFAEGEPGDCMLIVNRGKVEQTHKQIQMGILWAGKCFGVAQLLGIQRDYHATLRTKGTCHLLLLSRKALNTLAFVGSERAWMTSLRQRAQATLELELRFFERRYREHRRAVSRAAAAEVVHKVNSSPLSSVRDDSSSLPSSRRPSSHLQLRSRSHSVQSNYSDRHLGHCVKLSKERAADAMLGLQSEDLLANTFTAWRLFATLALAPPPRPPTRSHPAGRDLAMLNEMPKPIHFSRGLRRAFLESHADGVMSADVWRHWAQHGRLDKWKCVASSSWLAAVREEIPAQILSLKSQARGAETRLPGAGSML